VSILRNARIEFFAYIGGRKFGFLYAYIDSKMMEDNNSKIKFYKRSIIKQNIRFAARVSVYFYFIFASFVSVHKYIL